MKTGEMPKKVTGIQRNALLYGITFSRNRWYASITFALVVRTDWPQRSGGMELTCGVIDA